MKHTVDDGSFSSRCGFGRVLDCERLEAMKASIGGYRTRQRDENYVDEAFRAGISDSERGVRGRGRKIRDC